jgi:hypothetical protein
MKKAWYRVPGFFISELLQDRLHNVYPGIRTMKIFIKAYYPTHKSNNPCPGEDGMILLI